MSFLETPRFPDNVAINALSGPEYRTDIVELYSGFEQRNIAWSQGRIVMEIEMPLTAEEAATLDAWHRNVKGRAVGFRVRDWRDYAVTQTDGRLGESNNGTGVPTYQLAKLYDTGALIEYRKIRKPDTTTTLTVYRGGSPATAGAGAGQYAIDSTTGIVTWVANQSSSVTTIAAGASTVVTLSGSIGISVGGQLYLDGIVGTIATALNGLAHTVTSGSNPYTISTDTTGLSRTSGGTGYRYPQSTESLAWVGQFDVPMRFDQDRLSLRSYGGNQFRGESIILREVRV